MSNEFFHLGDAMRLLGTDHDGIMRLIDSGQLPAVVQHHGISIPKDALLTYRHAQQGGRPHGDR